MIDLPKRFTERITRMLGAESEEYFASLALPPTKGLHINTLKAGPDAVLSEIGGLTKIAGNCYSYAGEYASRPSAHPFHAAGLYYVQEPSAMLPVLSLPGLSSTEPLVLDMCAAPGGKTSQLASMLAGRGTLVANEIDHKRMLALKENVIRMGYANVVVTNQRPEYFGRNYKDCFDLVVVDAPCSGEGMFRKEKEAPLAWSVENVEACSVRQKEILRHAAGALKEGGLLLYSTCTFSEEEDESNADFIIDLGFESVDAKDVTGKLKKAGCGYKAFPHVFGEGQFFALFRKTSGGNSSLRNARALKEISEKERKAVSETFNLGGLKLKKSGDQVIIPASEAFNAFFLNGVTLGSFDKGRFIPSHQAFVSVLDLAKEKLEIGVGEKAAAYLHGMEIEGDERKCWAAVTVSGHALGGVKISGGIAKNHYPKWLRV